MPSYYAEHAQQLKRDLATEIPADALRELHRKRPLLHALVAMDLPGPGSVFMRQQWAFPRPVYIGETITAEATVTSVDSRRAIAERWCARCHAIAPTRRSAESEAPSFMRMAADRDLSREALRQLIRLPHYEMPPQSLTTPEIEDVISYILSLRR